MVYEVWVEGYSATGQSGKHRWIGTVEADNFKNACKIAMKKYLIEYYMNEKEAMDCYSKYYNEDNMTYWGCRLFDNEADAAKSFG